MSVNDVNKYIKDLKITDRTLIYPFELKDAINSSITSQSISFVKFTPSSPKIKMPVLVKKSDTGIPQEESTEVKEQQVMIDAIFLPIKPIVDSLSSNWSNVQGMGLGSLSEYLKWRAYKGLSGVMSRVLPEEVAIAMKTGAFGGGIDNPHDRQLYSGYSRRNFSVGWEFLKPTSREEEDVLTKIISFFRMSSMGGYGKLVITPPISWNVSFNSFPGYKNFLLYRRVGLQDVSVTFGGDGEFSAMSSGMPFMNLSLTCAELDFANRKDVAVRAGNASLLGDAPDTSITIEELEQEAKANLKK